MLTDDDANEVEWVTGNDDWVHGQDCKVTIFVRRVTGNRTKERNIPREVENGRFHQARSVLSWREIEGEIALRAAAKISQILVYNFFRI